MLIDPAPLRFTSGAGREVPFIRRLIFITSF